MGVLIIQLLAGCADHEDDAKDVAADYIEDRFGFSVSDRPVSVEREGPNWRVTYDVSPGHAGGDLIVWVDAETMKVDDFLGSQ